jgi:hypothetical protein
MDTTSAFVWAINKIINHQLDNINETLVYNAKV